MKYKRFVYSCEYNGINQKIDIYAVCKKDADFLGNKFSEIKGIPLSFVACKYNTNIAIIQELQKRYGEDLYKSQLDCLNLISLVNA